MHPSMFLKLRDILVERELIRESRYVTTSEQLAMFLYAMGHGVATGAMCEHFQHSSETISYYVNRVIKAISLLRFTYIVLPSGTDPVHPHIRHDDRFYPYFKLNPLAVWFKGRALTIRCDLIHLFREWLAIWMAKLATLLKMRIELTYYMGMLKEHSLTQLAHLNAAQAREGKAPVSPATFLDMNSIHLVLDPYKLWAERYNVFVALRQVLKEKQIFYPVTMDQFLACASFGKTSFIQCSMDADEYANFLSKQRTIYLSRMASTMGPTFFISDGAF
ncbi:hypothetical protein Taro_044463, partial [Colocasia esculenta]|nr:hypothetical protein [Colocasia esculenta]